MVAPGDLVAIKMHFGEKGNTAYIHPPFVRRIVEQVKKKGGKPFLVDTTTLYVGSRANAVDHLVTAIENGFAYAVVGAPLIIGDGLKGRDFVNVPIHQKHFSEVKIAASIYHADALFALSHFKGHEATGFGGALKNLGMGGGSRAGKQMMHSDVLPRLKLENCKGCAKCERWCPSGAIKVEEAKARIDSALCIGCGECVVTCPNQAVRISWKTEKDVIQEKIAEYALGVLSEKKGKAGFINFVLGVTPDCDCCSWSDAPLVRDLGILAAQDPVALDQASLDLVNQEIGLPGTRLNELHSRDKFGSIHGVDSTVQLAYAEKIGLGTREYRLIKI